MKALFSRSGWRGEFILARPAEPPPPPPPKTTPSGTAHRTVVRCTGLTKHWIGIGERGKPDAGPPPTACPLCGKPLEEAKQ